MTFSYEFDTARGATPVVEEGSYNFPQPIRKKSPAEFQVGQWSRLSGVIFTPQEIETYKELRMIAPQDGSPALSDPRLLASILPIDRRESFEAMFPHIFSPLQ